MTRAIIDDNADPYALRDAVESAIRMIERHAGVFDEKHLSTLRSLMTQLRPRASEGAVWTERVTGSLYRQHHVMCVSHLCDFETGESWERFVWPEEAQDALAIHIRERHPKATSYVDHLSAVGITRRSHITTGDPDA